MAEKTLLELLQEQVAWFGSQIETMPPADALLAAAWHLSAERVTEALALYRGEQWPSDVLTLRQEAHRPCLIINRLPELVATALNRATRPLTEDERDRVIAYVASTNGDAQRLYNYLASTLAEQANTKFTVL